MAYRTTNRDRSHNKIVAELKDMHYGVIDLAMVGKGVADLLVANRLVTALVEIKEPDGHIYISQLLTLATWKGQSIIAQTSDEVHHAMLHQKFLTDVDKAKMLDIVARYAAKSKADRPKISVAKFDKEMYES
jgi:hypothetical protein